jgi:hypothetical protein
MALLVRVYFNAVFGALGGLLGWLLFGVLGERNPEHPWQTALVGGACIGGVIGYFVVSVEAIRDRSLVRFCRLASYGVVLGMLGGAVGMLLGDEVNFRIVGAIGAGGGGTVLLGTMLARGLGWSLLGVAVGLSEGVAARSLGKLTYGTLGGALGGFVGGSLFALCYQATVRAAGGDAVLGYAWAALGLMLLGACIGSLSALVQGVFQPALVRVVRGWQEGREYALLKASNVVGRDERADVALFRDRKVEKQHALVRREGPDRFVLVNNGAPAAHTRVNDEPVSNRRELRDGDRIQLGDVVLRFHLRAARAPAGRPRATGGAPVATSRPTPLGKT